MKDNIIEIKVNKFQNLSEKIKQFIQQKSNLNYTPFYQEHENIVNHQNKRKPKRSLTDWRQLFEKKNNKIEPSKTFASSTAEGFRVRMAMTSQQRRQRPQYPNNKPHSMACNRLNGTKQEKRFRFSQNKRQSMIEFAFAQTHYQHSIMRSQHHYTLKQKEFLQNQKYSQKRQDYSKIGQFLSDIKPSITPSQEQSTLTDKYMQNLKMLGNVKLTTFNTAKIKNRHKINNSKFLEGHQELKEKRMLLKGLRYYSRG